MSDLNAEPPSEPRVLNDRYELGPVLGRGGMADVFRARDRTLDRDVAVKVLRETAGDESDRARFVREARTLAGLSHSGLVTVLDGGFGLGELAGSGAAVAASEHPFLVMELVEGRTLEQAMQTEHGERRRISLEDVRIVAVQVAEALAYVHRNGVVHRDVKPANILLGPQDRVRLADFGVARLMADSSGHTRTGHIIGSAAYLAPEQVTGEPVTGASDVYALGLVLLEAITGRRVFPGSPTEAAVARLHGEPEVPATLPQQWRDLLAAMLAKNAADRPTADEVAARLREDAVPAPEGSTPDATTRTTPAAAPTSVLPTSATGASASAPKPVPDRVGDALAHGTSSRARAAWASARTRAASTSESQRGVAGVLVALVLFLVVVAVAGNDGAKDDELPANTPSELVGPLRDLHDAVEGDG